MRTIAGEGCKLDETMETHVATMESGKWTPHAQSTLIEKIREDVVMKEVVELAAWLNLQSELFSQTVMTKESLKSMRESLFRREGPGWEFLRNLLLHNVLTQKQSAGTVDTSPKDLQDDYLRNMAVVTAEESAEKVFSKMMMMIADQEEECPALTKDEWQRVKGYEEKAENEHPTMEVREYLKETRQQEEEGKHEEQKVE